MIAALPRSAALVTALLATLPAAAAGQSVRRWSPSIGVTVNTALGRPDRNFGPGIEASLLRTGGRFSWGIEAGYQGLGTETTRIENFDQRPGWVYIEDFRRSMLRVTALARYDLGAGGVRPYLVAGAGGYNGRFKDHIEVIDQNGIPVPFYDFDESGSDVKPGINAGLGVRVGRAGRNVAVEAEVRWHGVIDWFDGSGLGTANFLSAGLALRF